MRMDPEQVMAAKRLGILALIWLVFMVVVAMFCFAFTNEKTAAKMERSGNNPFVARLAEDLLRPMESPAETAQVAAEALKRDEARWYNRATTLEQSVRTTNGCHLVKVLLHDGPYAGSPEEVSAQDLPIIPAGTEVQITSIPSDTSEEYEPCTRSSVVVVVYRPIVGSVE